MLEYENEMFLSALQVKCGKTKFGVKRSGEVRHTAIEVMESFHSKMYKKAMNNFRKLHLTWDSSRRMASPLQLKASVWSRSSSTL